LGPVVGYVRSHHEHWDGSGYADGLRGEEIPLGGRILGAAEVYDALTTARPYQDMLAPEDAVARMGGLAGATLDPVVLRALEATVARRQTLVFVDEETLPPDEGAAAAP
jgi:HD-GYP domain-containing protein (c-di-GMP phosphodiesterase class II)